MSRRPFVRDVVWLVALWFGVTVVLGTALLLASEGEPVCEGPLILSVDDSDPPQCDSPADGLIEQTPAVLIGSLLLASLARIVIVLAVIGARRVRARRLGQSAGVAS